MMIFTPTKIIVKLGKQPIKKWWHVGLPGFIGLHLHLGPHPEGYFGGSLKGENLDGIFGPADTGHSHKQLHGNYLSLVFLFKVAKYCF